jgi:hypothetical protein
MNFFKKKEKKLVEKVVTEIFFKNGKKAQFERPLNKNEINFDENENQLQKWWLNPYFPSGKIRLTTYYDYHRGRLYLDRRNILYIKVYVEESYI